MKYEFIRNNPEYPVAKWAEIIEIERTRYYAWLNKRETLEEKEAHLKKKINEVFEESGGTYGPDRIVNELRKRGKHIGRKKCAEYMADMDLSPVTTKPGAEALRTVKRHEVMNILIY